MNEFWLSPEDRELRKDEEIRQRQADEDLQRVANTPEGERVLLRLLEGWGAEGPVPNDIKAIALRNEAEELLSRLSKACPAVCMRIIAHLRGTVI